MPAEASLEVVGTHPQAAAGGADGASTSGQQPEASPLLRHAAQLLHKRFRVTLKDGRLLVGEFHCLDKQGNIILSNAYVHADGVEVMQEDRRIGLVLIPPSHRVSCEVEATPREAAALQQLLAGGSS